MFVFAGFFFERLQQVSRAARSHCCFCFTREFQPMSSVSLLSTFRRPKSLCVDGSVQPPPSRPPLCRSGYTWLEVKAEGSTEPRVEPHPQTYRPFVLFGGLAKHFEMSFSEAPSRVFRVFRVRSLQRKRCFLASSWSGSFAGSCKGTEIKQHSGN